MKSVKNGILILNIKQKRNSMNPAIKIKDCNAFFECFAKKGNKKNKLSDIFPNNGIWIKDQIKSNLAQNSFDFEGYLSDLGDKFSISAHKIGKKELVLVFIKKPSQESNNSKPGNELQLTGKQNNALYAIQRKKEAESPQILLNRTEKEEKTISSFFSNASHETKTLLNGIIGFAQFLKFKGQQENDAYVDVIINSGNRLLKVTNNLLYFTRLEAGYVRVKPYKCSLNNELDKLYSEIHEGNEDLKKKQVEFKTSYDLPNDADKLFIDNFNLMEVLKRLLDNAFKYTAEGEVRLEYKVENNNQLIFYVKDTGQGISKEKKNEILDTSTQLQDKIHGEIKGIGLGLIIARKLVNLMGGELNFDSKEGEGSSFYFNIPFKYAQQGKFMLNENQKQKPSVKISGLTNKKYMVG